MCPRQRREGYVDGGEPKAALARQGITVVAITHKDGSAAMTRYPNGNGGTVLGHYELPPNQLGEAYPPDYRVNQIEQRADEVQHMSSCCRVGCRGGGERANLRT